MRLVRPLVCLTAGLLLSVGAIAQAGAAGKRRSSWHAPKIVGGYAIPQIRRGTFAQPQAALKGSEGFSQLQAPHAGEQSGRPSYGLDPDKLARPPSGPNDPILKKFGLPYVAGVPTVLLLSPSPPTDDYTSLFGPRR